MKILLITGSPHKKGASALLTEKFIEGAKEKGHKVYQFDTAFKNIHPCVACNTCKHEDNGCVFKDDEYELYPKLLEADVIVFVSPIYYYGMSAQIKLCIDRFYGVGDKLHTAKKCALLLTCEDDTSESVESAISMVKGICNYLGWENVGIITALSCVDRAAIEKTEYPQMTYELAKKL